jgi:arsenate reductase
MRMFLFNKTVAALIIAIMAPNEKSSSPSMFKPVHDYLAGCEKEFDQIPAERRALLKELADYTKNRIAEKKPVRLLFVCTHNSRRSHMAQIWSIAAAAYYGLPLPSSYSGGTQATAFNPRAVAALERAGLRIQKTTNDDNPIYHVRFAEEEPAITAFSKTISHEPNPKTDFCVIMVCSDADRACPTVTGASERIAIPYEDPKSSDGTPNESRTYDDPSRQIAREMLYVMSLVKAK